MNVFYTISRAILVSLADASIRSLLLAAIAALFLWMFRVKRADVKHAAYSLVLIAMMGMPAAERVAPVIAIRVLRPVTAPLFPGSLLMPASNSKLTRGLRSADAAQEHPTWPLALAGIYGAGLLIIAGRLMRSYAAIRRLTRTARPLGADAYASDAVVVPMTVGWLRPKILLPAQSQNWDPDTRRAVLAHERAHIERMDWLAAMAASVNRCIFWFHPLAWWLQKKLAALAEDAADDRSILVVGDRHAYAKVLVDIAASLNGQVNRVVWDSVAMARRADVSRRVDSILDSTRPLATGLSATGWLAIAVCLLPVFYGSAAAQLQSRTDDRAANQTLLSGLALTQEQVNDLEERVRLNADDVESRTKLISYYFQNGKADERMRHVLWMIENHPDAGVLNALVGRVDAMDVPGAFEQAKLLWQANEKAHSSDARVLINAASFYGASDLKHTESLLLRAAEIDSANAQPRLLMLYTMVLMAATDPNRALVNNPYNQPEFADHVVTVLTESNDGQIVARVGRSLAQTGQASPERAQLAERLLNRASALGVTLPPPEPRGTQALNPQPATPGVMRIRVGGAVQDTKVTKRVTPEYPALARQARIQGVVRFDVVIGVDGAISSMTLISGHPLLVLPAQAALRNWTYQPTLLNGKPVEVKTTVDVNFLLSQ